jgi:hypothetical protein
MKIQVLIVLLVVLALALVAGLVLGPALEGQPGRESAFLDWARERSGALEKRVRRGDLRASPDACLQSDTLVLASGGRCRVEIASADDRVRTIELELETPDEVHLSLEHRDPDQGLDIDTTLQQGDPLTLQVYERGGSLVLSECSAGSNQMCQIRFN